ncbi:MAG: tandem-95 repeat protein [Paracoccaceae bacterium]
MSIVKWFGSFANGAASAFGSTGATLSQITLGTPITAAELENVDVFVFGSGNPNGNGDALSASEISAIKAFVEAGGKLIVVGEVSFFPTINNEGKSLLGGVGASARLSSNNLSGAATFGDTLYNTNAGLVGKSFELSSGSTVAANGATALATLSGGTAVLTVEGVGSNGGQVFVLSDNISPGKDFALSMLPDSAPSLPADATIDYAENQTTPVYDAAATDDRSSEGNGLTYSILDGGDGAKFAIDPDTGKLTFLSAPDFEAPTDSDANNSYVVTIRAQDAAGQTDDQTITVNVTDVDDTAPTGLTATSGIQIPVESGFNIRAAIAIDTFERWDWPAIDDLLAGVGALKVSTTTATTLDFSGWNFPFGDADYFALKATGFVTIPESGIWTFQTFANDGLRLRINGQEVDFNFSTTPGTGTLNLAAGTYEIEATYFEITGAQVFSLSAKGPGDSDFTLVNGAGSSLSVTQSLPLENTVLLKEVTEAGTIIATFSATDSDPNLTYSLVPGEGSEGNSLFYISDNTLRYTGQGADYETAPNLTFRLRVTDSAGNWTEKVVNVGVLDIDEAPVKSGTISLAAALEDTTYTLSKADLLAGYSDPEGGTLSISDLTVSNGTVQDLGNAFRITPSANFNGNVTLTFSVSDGTNTLTNQTTTLTVTPVPDAPTSKDYLIQPSEDKVHVFSASDFPFNDFDDAASGAHAFAGVVIGSLPANGTVSLDGVAVKAGQFITAADIAAGKLTFLGALDFFGNTSLTFRVRDTAEVGAWETRLWSATAPTELISGWSGSGYHSGIGAFAPGGQPFLPSTSALVFIEKAHFATSTISTNDNQTATAETGATYTLNFDQINGVGYGSSAVTVRIYAGDILLLQSTTASIADSTQAARSFTTNATDADLTGLKLRVVFESASGLTYLDNIVLTKVGGDGANLLINGDFGSRDYAPGANESPLYTLAIQVQPVNDAPIITSNGGGETAAVSVAENTTAVTTVTVSDDGGASQISYILKGDDFDRFTINSATGALSFVSAPDFENPASRDGDNTYSVIVIAVDNGNLYDQQTITVTVTDVDDTPPQVAITAEQTTLSEDDTSTLLTFTFTEPVSGLAVGDFTVQGGTLSDLTQSTENPLVWTALLTGSSGTDIQTSITLTIGQGFTDAAGNAGSITSAPSLTIDTTADIGGNLALTLDSLSDDGVLDPADARFSVAGLDADATATLTVTSSGGGSFTFEGITGNGAFTLSADLFAELASGTLTLTLNVTDKSGNTASSEKTATFDVTPPEVTTALFSGMLSDDGVITDADVAAGNLITLSITFSEAMNTADPEDIQITLPENCGLTETGTRLWNGDTLTITYELSDTGVEIGDLAISVAGARDVVGNVMEQQTVQSGSSVDTRNPEGHAGSSTRAEVPDELAAGLAETELAVFSLAEGETLRFAAEGNPHSAFVLDGGRLLIGDASAFDFETRTQLVASLIVSDAAGNETAYDYTINLTNTNDAPILQPGGLAQVTGKLEEGATPSRQAASSSCTTTTPPIATPSSFATSPRPTTNSSVSSPPG